MIDFAKMSNFFYFLCFHKRDNLFCLFYENIKSFKDLLYSNTLMHRYTLCRYTNINQAQTWNAYCTIFIIIFPIVIFTSITFEKFQNYKYNIKKRNSKKINRYTLACVNFLFFD